MRNRSGGGKTESDSLRMLLPAVILIAVLFFFSALSNLEEGQNEEGRLQLEQVVRRASAACYAAEGIYPPNLEYLKEHYGLQIDEKRYIVHYEIFASNLMPDITVISRQEGL